MSSIQIEKKYAFYGANSADSKPINPAFSFVKNPRHLYDLLTKIWSKETCAPRLRPLWTAGNKTLGQCSITAFLAQDIFGGKVFGIKREGGNFHCYNQVENSIFDLTSEQFGNEKLDYSNNPIQLREIHFSKEEKKLRYEYLKSELLKLSKQEYL